MFTISIEDLHFRQALAKYAEQTGKNLGEAVKEQARLLAERLTRLTPPFSKAQGTNAVERDIRRVYLRDEWFTDTFTFRNEKLDERVKNSVRAKDANDLQAIFWNSPKLNRIHIEPFSPAKHERARRNGRVTYPSPFSYPLQDQSKVKSYIRAKKGLVGLARSGWGYCAAKLGASIAGWLQRPVGDVIDDTGEENPSVTIINKVSYFAALDAKSNIVARALEGRARDMAKAARYALKKAAEAAGLSS